MVWGPLGQRKHRQRGERGVTMVEYVLFVGGFVMIALTAVGGLNGTARDYFQQSGSRIGQPVNRIQYGADGTRQQQASTTTITAPTATTTIAPTTASPTTTTIAPTTTAAPTTAPTTTATPTTTPATTTTTVAPATTTTTAPKRLSSSLSDYSDVDPSDSSRWVAEVRVSLTATGGASTSGISIGATFTRSNGTSVTRSCVTNSSGVCYMSWSNRSYSQTWIDVDITSVTGGSTWTGSTDHIRLFQP